MNPKKSRTESVTPLIPFTSFVLLFNGVTASQLSNMLVDHTIVKRLSLRLLLVAETSGLPMSPFIKQSKVAVVYLVYCTYSRNKFDAAKLYAIAGKIWRRVAMTYLWVCMLIVGCPTLFLFLLVAVCSTFSLFRFKLEVIVYPAETEMGLVFSVQFANCIIICNIAIVISVLEDVSGPQVLLNSSVLGQTQVGLLIFLGSTIGIWNDIC